MGTTKDPLTELLDRAQALDVPAARRLLDAATGEVRGASMFHHVRGVLALRAGDPDAAIDALTEACTLEPEIAEHRGLLGAAYLEKRDGARARQELEAAFAMGPITPDVGTALALACEVTGDPTRALSVVDAVLERFPHHPPALFNRASALRALGRTEEARAALEALLLLAPDFAPARAALARAAPTRL